MFHLSSSLTRKSLRVYIFLVVFGCSLTLFTLAPIDTVRTPRRIKSVLHWNLSIPPEYPAPSHLEYDSLHLDSNSLYPEPPNLDRKASVSRPSHTFRPDGLLQVTPGGRHPILDLIARAEDEWNTTLSNASQTLPE